MSSSPENKVFVSYAHDDLPTVRKLYADLKARSVKVWMDKEDIGPGRWKPQIQKAIPKSRYFLFCLSKSALQKTADGSGFIDDELQWAYQIALEQDDRHFTIVPVRLEDVDRGDHRLSVFQQYDLFTEWDRSVDELAVLLGGRSLGQPVQETEKSDDEKLIDSLLGKALATFYADDLMKSLQIVETILSLSQEKVDAWSLKSGVLNGLRRHEEALAAAETAVKLNPADAGTWYVKANALGQQGRFQEALEAIEKSLSLNRDDYLSWFLMGASLGGLNRHEDSLAAFERSVSLNPDYAVGWFAKGRALGVLSRFQEALDTFEHLEKIEKIDPTAQLLLKKEKAYVLKKNGTI